MSATLNGLRVVAATLTIPWRGAWYADIDLDPDVTSTPVGAATLSALGATFDGTIDPRATGRFLASIRVRLVAGAGMWNQPIARQAFHNDAGVQSTQVYQAAAALVGEKVNDPTPVTYAGDFLQMAGRPASQVFRDRDYYLDFAGVTQVASWPAATLDSSATILSYTADEQRVDASTDVVIVPGTTLTDARFDGALTVRDVELHIGPKGTRATLWCSTSPVERLQSALTNMVRSFAATDALRSYRYRVVQQHSDGRIMLQAVNAALGAPDIGPIDPWPGMQGDKATVALSSECDVRLQEGDRSRPIISNWSPAAIPLKRTVDATVELDMGPSAAVVKIAGGTSPVALSPLVAGELVKIATAITGLGGTYVPGSVAASKTEAA